jgi:hypothetical protein
MQFNCKSKSNSTIDSSSLLHQVVGCFWMISILFPFCMLLFCFCFGSVVFFFIFFSTQRLPATFSHVFLLPFAGSRLPKFRSGSDGFQQLHLALCRRLCATLALPGLGILDTRRRVEVLGSQ